MKTIYRYEINNSSGFNEVEMPDSAKVLSVGLSDENVMSLWALVDTNDITTSKHTFIVAGTGADLDEALSFNHKFIGTVCSKKNGYAFHIFEINDKTIYF